MSEYTKGPWIMIENHTNISIATGQYADGGHQVAFVAGNPNLPNRRANARLMSSAPELLEALRAWENLFLSDFAISLTTRRPMTNADQNEIDAVLIKARAAIAKADGR